MKKVEVDRRKSLNDPLYYKIEDECATPIFPNIKTYTRQILKVQFPRITHDLVICFLKDKTYKRQIFKVKIKRHLQFYNQLYFSYLQTTKFKKFKSRLIRN